MPVSNRSIEKTPVKLSVIIPCYNAASTLPAQLDALADDVWSESWEVIIVDNGSTDETVLRAQPFVERFSSWRIVDASGGKGPGYARNTGVRVARGEYLAFCDADDVIEPGWVSAIGEALAQHDLVGSRLEYEKLNGTESLGYNLPQERGLRQQLYNSAFLPFVGGTGLAVRREVFEKLGGFDEALKCGEDIDFCWRTQLEGSDLHFENTAVINYRLRSRPKDTYKQTFNHAFWTVAIYKRYRRHGMSGVRWQSGVKMWLRLLFIKLPQLAKRSSREKWINNFARRCGLLLGSIRFKTLML